MKQEKLEKIKQLVELAKKSIPEIQEVYKEFKDKNISSTDEKWFEDKVKYIKSLHSGLKINVNGLRTIITNFYSNLPTNKQSNLK